MGKSCSPRPLQPLHRAPLPAAAGGAQTSARFVSPQGGDRPQNRKQDAQKAKKREGGGGDGDGGKRKSDGKPVKLKGIGTYKAPECG